jgi:hypothetical protein
MISKLWVDLAESRNFHRIVTIMGKQLENDPNYKYTLTYYIVQLLNKENIHLNAEKFNEDLHKMRITSFGGLHGLRP